MSFFYSLSCGKVQFQENFLTSCWLTRGLPSYRPQHYCSVTKVHGQLAFVRGEAAPGKVTTWVRFQLDAPGRHLWDILSLRGAGTIYRQTMGNERGARFCCLAA